jgi:serine/threonine protein kinase
MGNEQPPRARNGSRDESSSHHPAVDGAGGMVCPTCGTEYGADTRFCPRDGSVLRPLAGDGGELVGSVVDGRYYLIEKVGQGGMGEVYRGEHVRTRRQCAVKIINRSLARDAEALNRFIREATNAGRISHPHVAAVYDFGETEDGLLYLAMDYVDGEPLSKLLEREGALPPARAVEIARQVADAVAAAHELGIIHRDLKPSNIMVARNRSGGDLVQVVDFGIARTVGDEQQRLTRTGLVIGTPEFMSPEQLIGDPVDGRSDIYSLGCILYQMLTGEHAFGGSTASVITRRLTEAPPRPRDRNPAIPKPLDEVIVTALGRTPEERFKTMDAMRDALLTAPTQPVSTGPRRIAAWLGLTDQAQQRAAAGPSEPTPPAAEEADAATVSHDSSPEESLGPVDMPAPPVDASFDTSPEATDELEPSFGTPSFDVPQPEAADLVPEAAEPSYAREAEAAGGEHPAALVGSDFGSDPGALEEKPHRLLTTPKAWLGLGLVAAVLISSFVVLRPEQAGEATPPVNDHTGTTRGPGTGGPDADPERAARLVQTVLADLRAELAQAEEEVQARDFDPAILRLRSVHAGLAHLAGEYPEEAEVHMLADSVGAHLATLVTQCNALRRVQLDLNRPAPVCEQE